MVDEKSSLNRKNSPQGFKPEVIKIN